MNHRVAERESNAKSSNVMDDRKLISSSKEDDASDVDQGCFSRKRPAAEAFGFEGYDCNESEQGDADSVSDSEFDSFFVSDDRSEDPIKDNLAGKVKIRSLTIRG